MNGSQQTMGAAAAAAGQEPVGTTRRFALDRFERFLEASDLSAGQLGERALNDRKFMSRLRTGAGVTLRSIERVEQFIADWQAGKRSDPPDGPDAD